MNLTADISLYPIQDNYIPIIQAFINAIKQDPNLRVVENAMSTQIGGAYDKVMTAVGREMQASYEKFGAQVLVVKFIPGIIELEE
jgi:uncharacterized protein YqgV (UPF0045/DUF77 family)